LPSDDANLLTGLDRERELRRVTHGLAVFGVDNGKNPEGAGSVATRSEACSENIEVDFNKAGILTVVAIKRRSR